MDPSSLPEPGDAAPPYAVLAHRLLTEHAELFRVSAASRSRPPQPFEPAVPAPRRRGARRNPQLSLPLRPHVLDGGAREGH